MLAAPTSIPGSSSLISSPSRSLGFPQLAFLTLLFTLGASALDQFIAPVLYTTSPLWGSGAFLLLVWRRGPLALSSDFPRENFSFSLPRIVLYFAAHLALICAALLLGAAVQPVGGTVSAAGWVLAFVKLSVLVPTLLLLPFSLWRKLARIYFSESVAAAVVLFTFFPGRIMEALWPWYSQALGHCVFFISRPFVPALGYLANLDPTLAGPHLDVKILLSCSGISGLNLFDYLFAFVVLLDWNRLRKGRTLLAYFGGVAVILFGNVFRISAFVVFGNHGFADAVARFHISAGWIIFTAVFLVFLTFAYPRLLAPLSADWRPADSSFERCETF